MGGMLFNKILGAGLATVLVILGLINLPSLLFSQGGEGHHDDHHGEELSLNEQIAATYAYYVPIADGGSSGSEEPKEVFDLGLALASADVDRGASSFQQKCASCHVIEAGAANGIGPNLHNVVGAAKHHHDDFRYSSAMEEMDGDWTYEDLDHWLKSPSSYISGTSMGFAGLNRDSERANVIAFLAAQTENAPAFPDPLPEVSEETPAEATEGEEAPAAEDTAEEATSEDAETTEAVEPASVEDITDSAVEAVESTIEETVDTVEEAAEDLAEEAEEATEHTGDEH